MPDINSHKIYVVVEEPDHVKYVQLAEADWEKMEKLLKPSSARGRDPWTEWTNPEKRTPVINGWLRTGIYLDKSTGRLKCESYFEPPEMGTKGRFRHKPIWKGLMPVRVEIPKEIQLGQGMAIDTKRTRQ